jgi:hypothetical protein
LILKLAGAEEGVEGAAAAQAVVLILGLEEVAVFNAAPL